MCLWLSASILIIRVSRPPLPRPTLFPSTLFPVLLHYTLPVHELGSISPRMYLFPSLLQSPVREWLNKRGFISYHDPPRLYKDAIIHSEDYFAIRTEVYRHYFGYGRTTTENQEGHIESDAAYAVARIFGPTKVLRLEEIISRELKAHGQSLPSFPQTEYLVGPTPISTDPSTLIYEAGNPKPSPQFENIYVPSPVLLQDSVRLNNLPFLKFRGRANLPVFDVNLLTRGEYTQLRSQFHQHSSQTDTELRHTFANRNTATLSDIYHAERVDKKSSERFVDETFYKADSIASDIDHVIRVLTERWYDLVLNESIRSSRKSPPPETEITAKEKNTVSEKKTAKPKKNAPARAGDQVSHERIRTSTKSPTPDLEVMPKDGKNTSEVKTDTPEKKPPPRASHLTFIDIPHWSTRVVQARGSWEELEDRERILQHPSMGELRGGIFIPRGLDNPHYQGVWTSKFNREEGGEVSPTALQEAGLDPGSTILYDDFWPVGLRDENNDPILPPGGANVLLGAWSTHGVLSLIKDFMPADKRQKRWPKNFNKDGSPKAEGAKYGHGSKAYSEDGILLYKVWCQYIIMLGGEGMRTRLDIGSRPTVTNVKDQKSVRGELIKQEKAFMLISGPCSQSVMDPVVCRDETRCTLEQAEEARYEALKMKQAAAEVREAIKTRELSQRRQVSRANQNSTTLNKTEKRKNSSPHSATREKKNKIYPFARRATDKPRDSEASIPADQDGSASLQARRIKELETELANEKSRRKKIEEEVRRSHRVRLAYHRAYSWAFEDALDSGSLEEPDPGIYLEQHLTLAEGHESWGVPYKMGREERYEDKGTIDKAMIAKGAREEYQGIEDSIE